MRVNDEQTDREIHGDTESEYEGLVLRNETHGHDAFLANFSAVAGLAVLPDQLKDAGDHSPQP